MASENGLGNNATVLFTFDDVEPNFCCPQFIVKTYHPILILELMFSSLSQTIVHATEEFIQIVLLMEKLL